jgi:zinc and cadmium transporter
VPTADPTLATLLAIVGLTGAVGLASAAVASLFVVLPERMRRAIVPHLVSFATGALLGAALIGLLPSAIKGAGLWNGHKVGLALLAGLLFFFLLEKLVLWHHCHDEDAHAGGPRGSGDDAHGGHGGHAAQAAHADHAHAHAHAHANANANANAHSHAASHGHVPVTDSHREHVTGPMVLWGDAFHNVLDGVVIAAAYMTNPALGIATAIAVFTHELPTEIGDIAILLHSGMSRARALLLNALVSLAAVVGGIFAFYTLGAALKWLPYALAFASASLLYIAVADLIPGLHRRTEPLATLKQVALILLGLVAIWLTQPPSMPGAGTSLL